MKPIDFASLTALCRRIRAVFPNAIIGGGAPRDVFLGGAVKDIDVFVQCRIEDFKRLGDELAYQLKGTAVGGNGYVHAPSFDILVHGLPPLNIIQRDISPLMDVGDYDFGISQIAVDGFTVIRSAACQKDVADNTITYMHAGVDKPEWHVLSSKKRLQRILAKYPSLSPVNCEKLVEHGVYVPAWN